MKIYVIILATLSMMIGLNAVNAQEEAASEGNMPKDAKHKQHHGQMMDKMKQHQNRRMKDHLIGLDTNDDGKVDLDEYLAKAKERFSNMDINGDNFVTSEEAREAHQKMREKHRAERQKHFEKRKEGQAQRSNKDAATETE